MSQIPKWKIKAMILLEDNISINLCDFGFLDVTPQAQAHRKKKRKMKRTPPNLKSVVQKTILRTEGRKCFKLQGLTCKTEGRWTWKSSSWRLVAGALSWPHAALGPAPSLDKTGGRVFREQE